jgi:hypothetical protein
MDLASSPPAKRRCSAPPSLIPETQFDPVLPSKNAESELALLREENETLRAVLRDIKARLADLKSIDFSQ